MSVVSGSEDRTVRLWNAATGVALQTPEGHSLEVSSVAFSADGKVVDTLLLASILEADFRGVQVDQR